MLGIMSYAFEENNEGQTEVEQEKTFYAIMAMDALTAATDFEDQEQWQVNLTVSPNLGKARMRVRKTTKSGTEPEYTQTIKVDLEGSTVGNTKVKETQMVVTEDFFQAVADLSDRGMSKRRLFLKDINGLELQIDVFKTNGGFSDRVKIDYEYSSGMPATPTLPSIFTDIVPGDTADEGGKQRIREWYDTIFMIKR